MGRAVILGNGGLTVGLDENGLVHDFYYPYVGLDNLTTARSIHHRIGVWVDGQFSWTDDPSWETQVDFSSEALISSVIIRNQELGIALESKDFVDFEDDAFCRMLTVKNESESPKNIRIFMHQVFEISSDGRADTAMYDPDGNYILDYKGRCCLLISGVKSDGSSFDQYAVGNYGIEGKQGTYMDAEDGELSGHAVEHGGVDSVIRFVFSLEPNQESSFDYWIIAGDTQYNCDNIHSKFQDGLADRIKLNQLHWQQWLSIGQKRLAQASEDQQAFARKSLLTIKAHIDKRGGIIASCDSSIYNYGRDYYSYVWPRDGAYAVWPLIRLGYNDEAKSFFRFCADIATPEGYLMHKYQPDRAIGSTWHPLIHDRKRELAIQEDETAIVLIMLGEYYEYSQDKAFIQELYPSFITKAADFLASFIDEATGLPHASYDLWEEKFLTNFYTTACVYRALVVASDLAQIFEDSAKHDAWKAASEALLDRRQVFINPDNQTFRKGFLLQDDGSLAFDNTIDMSSFYGAMTFGFYPDSEVAQVRQTIQNIISTLNQHSPSGGSPRYENDGYFRTSQEYLGNPWIITSLWIAQFYIRTNRQGEAIKELAWVQSCALPSGVLPEQIHPENKTPVSVAPLVWSHAEYINTVLDLTQMRSK